MFIRSPQSPGGSDLSRPAIEGFLVRRRSAPLQCRMARDITRYLTASLLALAAAEACAQTPQKYGEFACRPLTCSSLVPSKSVDDPSTNDCGYRAGNQWWLDHVA